jgi:23S rRNA (uracil1939-C5)-methyltransferase
VGYFARRSHDLVPIRVCPILVPELEALLPALPAHLAAASPPPRRLDLAAGDDGRVAAAPPLPGLPGGELEAAVGSWRFAYDARVFFQGHRQLLPALVERVVGTWGGEEAFDLYAGVGLFSLPLARRYTRVTAVEGDQQAARFARKNVRANRVANVEIVARSLEGWIRALPRGAERVVVDPPRDGLGLVVRRVLADRAPRRITYVSCHAAALSRDLRELMPAYRVESLHLVDLFPQSGHLEVVAQLERA